MQWYPGHIARAERLLRDQLKNVDCVVEVRDLRIPLATSHPNVAAWVGSSRDNSNNNANNSSSGKLHITVLNRSDMVDEQERAKWVSYFKHKMKERHVIVTDAKSGRGVEQVKKNRAQRSEGGERKADSERFIGETGENCGGWVPKRREIGVD